jgi:hypothetical protein
MGTQFWGVFGGCAVALAKSLLAEVIARHRARLPDVGSVTINDGLRATMNRGDSPKGVVWPLASGGVLSVPLGCQRRSPLAPVGLAAGRVRLQGLGVLLQLPGGLHLPKRPEVLGEVAGRGQGAEMGGAVHTALAGQGVLVQVSAACASPSSRSSTARLLAVISVSGLSRPSTRRQRARVSSFRSRAARVAAGPAAVCATFLAASVPLVPPEAR